uniref:ARID domain-containing protein n=1 Tax=Trichobilharzia regenti TaxID=157069 RepID=A0AA85JA46_TRIRE|nr:unnamed protein product [Trichobilharzia regenti]
MTTQITNIQSQPATCASPGQTKGPYQSCQTVPSPRPQGVSNQEMGILRMGYPSYSHPQAPLPNNPYSSGGRTPGFPSAGYSLRPPSMHAAVSLSDSIPYRQQFQTQSSSGPASTSSMPPPPTLPPASVSSSQSCAGDNNGPSQPPFSQVLPYSTPVSSTSSGYATPGSVHGPHLPWDQEASYQPTPHHPSNMFHHQFGGRPPYIGPPDRGSGYLPSSSVPSSNASNSVPHNGQHLHPSATGPYPHNQSLSSYAIHHAQYPYSQSQMPYHSQSQYTHPYSPGPGAPVIQQQQQHMAASTGAMASTYSSPMLNNASPLPHHLLNSRDGFHMHYPHDVQQHPSVSSSNENFTPASFPQNGGSPGNIRPSSVINSVSKPVVAGGKMTKSELLTRPVNSTISASSQISTNQTGLGPTEVNSMNFPQQYQHRVPGQSSHPQMLQQYPGNYPSGIGSHRFGAPSGGGEILQGSSTFQSFQQQYHSIPNSHVPPEPQNTSGPIDNQSSLYSSDETHSDVGNLNQTLNNLSSQSLTGFHKLLEMGNEPERRPWLENYMRFMDDIGKPVVGIPQVVKQPLDLYRFYVAVRERGGVAEVIKARRWKEVSQAIGINASASAAYGLRKNYCKFLLEYECRFDRDGSDPRPLLTHIENLSGKKRKCSSVDSDPNSLSNDLPPPAPPSPTGSHSSASSSLLPPGSSGASLSGGPSGTAGSAASDSQLGPPSSQQHRFSDHGQPGSVSTVPESPNGIPNVPSPPGLSGQSSNSYLPSSGPATMNVPSPQRPLSCTVANGYSNVPISASDSNCCPWPWTPENSNSESGTHQTPAASESSTMEHSGILVTREATSSQYAQSRIPSGSISFNSNVLPSNVYAGGPNPNCASSAPSGNTEPMAQHNFNPYLPQNPVFVSNPSHPVLSQHHGPPQLMDHPFTGSQSPIHPRHPTNHSFRTPSFNTATPPNAVSSDSVAMFRMHQLRSGAPPMSPYMSVGAVTPYSAHNNNNNNNSNLSQNSPLPPHLTQHGNQRPGYVATILKRLDHYTFPPGSVEATPIDSPRRRRYRAKDLGPIPPFKLLMALRSGLTAEVSWALNCLNILLRDENGFDLIVPSALPGLLTSLVDIWRHTLGELFNHDLFITSLELPTDLSVISTSQNHTKHNSVLKNVHNNYSCNFKTSLSYLDVKSKSSPHDNTCGGSANVLIRLEREISQIAAIKCVSLSSVRNGLRNLLGKRNDSRSLQTPVRFRSGLMFRPENLSPMSTTTVNHSAIMSCSSSNKLVDTNTHSVIPVTSRARKRGKQMLFSSSTTSNNYMSGSTGEQFHASIMPSNINFSNVGTWGKADRIVMWSTPQVASIMDSLRAPEAYSNLKDLALYVIDALHDESHSNHSSEITDSSCSTTQENNNKPSVTKRSSCTLRKLIEKGGGDTTCHIMPPFGAHAFQSSHWMNDQENILSNIDDDRLPKLTEPPPPPTTTVGITLKQSVSVDGSNDELIKIGELDDDQPHSKRMRHASSSSLPCPTLSPQPTCDTVSEDIPCKLIELHDTNSITEINCCEDNDDLVFSQLIDENGRCPLRAREELVHHGAICLWPDHNEADSYEARAVRCLCVSTVLRNLSFINTVERHLSNQKGVLALIGRLMLFGHEHVEENDTWYAVERKTHNLESSFCAWWTPTWLEDMRENAMVLLVNVAGYLELIHFDESIVRPILEGLLHWITCTTSASVDPFPGHRTLSPRRLALEALNRLCVHETNVDLLMSTPSDEKVLSSLFDRLATWLAVPEDQVTRELALSTMHYLAGGGASISASSVSSSIKSTSETNTPTNTYVGTTMLAGAKPCPVSGLLAFIEAAEATTRRVIDQYGVQALQERPELMGTSLEMVRRAGALLDRLAVDSKGRTSFTPDLELRLMDLVTSRVLDATVAHLLCGALHRLLPDNSQIDEDIKCPTIPPIPSAAFIAELLEPTIATSANVSQERTHQTVDTSSKVTCTENTSEISGSNHDKKQSVVSNSVSSEVTNENDTVVSEGDSKKSNIDKSPDKKIIVNCKNSPIDNASSSNNTVISKDYCKEDKKLNGSIITDKYNVNCKSEISDFKDTAVNDHTNVYLNNPDSQLKINCMNSS